MSAAASAAIDTKSDAYRASVADWIAAHGVTRVEPVVDPARRVAVMVPDRLDPTDRRIADLAGVMTAQDIADHLSIHVATVRRRMARRGMTALRPDRRSTDLSAVIDRIAPALRLAWSDRRIAGEFAISRRQVAAARRVFLLQRGRR